MKSALFKCVFVLFVVATIWLGYLFLGSGPEEATKTKRGQVTRGARVSSIERALLKKQLGTFMHAMTRETQKRVRVSGTVRESWTGDPIASAEVVFDGEGGESTTFSGEDGRYNIALVPGAFRVLARAEGHVAVGWSPRGVSSKTQSSDDVNTLRLELAPVANVTKNQRGVDIHLRTSATIEGVVRDQDGRPVADAIVASKSYNRNGFLRTLFGRDMAVSDSNGAFKIVVPSGEINLVTSHDDFAGLSKESPRFLYIEPGDTRHVDLTLVDGCIISGQVVDSSGAIFEKGAIELGTSHEAPHDFSHAGMFANGQFRFVRTEPGNVRLRVWPWRASPAPVQEFACEDGDLHVDVIVVERDDPPDLTGSLRSEDGESIVGARLFIYPFEPDGMSQWEESDAGGEWSVFSLPAGEYLVSASVPGHGVASRAVTVPSNGVDLVLGGTGSISGTVSGIDNGSFMFTPNMCFHNVQGQSFRVPLGIGIKQDTRLVLIEDGRYHIDNLPACDIRGIAASNERVENVSVNILEDQVATLSLSLHAP
ncbi:MAG: carboxypeptidase regulatory-like domain-containing protein [Deltaproteobacteria bacterium]|nr:carboxypeptidase regulatory-like domain-containing protein [Deltaproteobacteria bacterium]